MTTTAMADNGGEERELKKYGDRQYQIELYLAAKEQNIIACLGTGTGKTFIAIKLMSDPKYMSQLSGSWLSGEAKRTFFLVPTRPLVHQQCLAIKTAEQTADLKVKGFTGDMNVDFYDKTKWDKELVENEVIVMTPAILKDMFEHSYITFDRINLLVVDEVHWAAKRKNKKESGHPYKQIMKIYNSYDPETRPRVLGLSATPINCSMKVDDFNGAVKDIEDTYSAKCMTGDVANYGTNPQEIVWVYNNYDSALSPTGQTVFESLNLFIQCTKDTIKGFKDKRKLPTVVTRLKKILRNVRNVLANPEEGDKNITDDYTGEKYPVFMTWMGEWCASLCVEHYIREINEYKEVYEEVDPLEANIYKCCVTYLTHIQRILTPVLNPMSVLDTASPKMKRLLEILRGYQPIGDQESTLCGIIFVNQRVVTKVLADWLKELKRLMPHIYGFLNVGWVVGHSARPGIEAKIATNSDKKQQKTVEQFHKKELNLLIATSVLEEGLDVRKCNLVVRYDRLNTFREYLQSKGRARAESAYYYIMTSNEDTSQMYKKLNDFTLMEESIKNINSRVSGGGEVADVEDEDEEEDMFYLVESTKAKLTARSAIALLYKYCNKLPSDSFTQLQPVFKINESHGLGLVRSYMGSVKMPVNCQLKGWIDGPLKSESDAAKRAVALRACRRLHELGELDDHLLPVSKEKRIAEYIEKLGLRRDTFGTDSTEKVGTRSRRELVSKPIAKEFSYDNERSGYYLHKIDIKFPKRVSLPNNYLTLGVITRRPVAFDSQLPVYLKTCSDGTIVNSEFGVKYSLIRELILTSDEKESIEKFHSYAIEEVMRFSIENLTFDSLNSSFKVLIVPLKNSFEIDWSFINKINRLGAIDVKRVSEEERIRYAFSEEVFEDSVFIPWYKENDFNNRPIVYYFVRVSDLNSNSDWIETDIRYKTFDDYYRKNWKLNIQNKSQPLIEGRVANRSMKGLFKGAQLKPYLSKSKEKFAEYFPPELLTIHPIPSSLWRQLLCLPAVLYRLNHMFLAEDLRKTIHLTTVPCIGSLVPKDNVLKIDSISNENPFLAEPKIELKREFYYQDSDDECDGHRFDDEMEVDGDFKVRVWPKRVRKEIKVADDTSTQNTRIVSNITVPHNTVNSSIVSTIGQAVNNLKDLTTALIFNFKGLVNSYTSGTDFLLKEQLSLEIIMREIAERSHTAFPNLRYGDAFPFIFDGNIDAFIRQKYDTTVDEPIGGPTAEIILQALTLMGADDAFNLERLEVIGDSFLKFVSSAYIFFSCPELDEGRMSYLRQIQICNCNLYFIGREKQIEKLLVSHKWFPNTNWLPPCYHILDEKDCQLLNEAKEKELKIGSSYKNRRINNKSIADSIEALIGAHLLYGGVKSALIFMEWLGLKVAPNESLPIDYENKRNLRSTEQFRWLPTPKDPICTQISEGVESVHDFERKHYFGANLYDFEKIIGYKFRNKAFLIQALTHSSFYFNELTDCYQKLEFLGDSIIDYLISYHIYSTPNKKFSPGELTDLRSALVNNSFFAAIAVKYKFHKFLKNLSPDLFRAIQNFEKNFIAGETESVINSFKKMTEEETNDLEEVDVPKALGDIFESVAGAIYLDNGLSLDGVWRVYYKLLKPEIDYFSENIPIMPVQQIWQKCKSGAKPFGVSEKVGRKTRVVLTFNDKEYGGVGKNRKFAKIAASKNALKDIDLIQK